MTHPALDSLILLLNGNKPYTKENLKKWVSPLPDKEEKYLLNKINQNITKEDFLSLLNDIKSGIVNITIPQIPSICKKGDVFMHPVFMHPYILLDKKQDYWICTLMTTEITCKEILEPCNSRFFPNSFITQILFTTTAEPVGKFIFPYDNTRQLNLIIKKLRSVFACL